MHTPNHRRSRRVAAAAAAGILATPLFLALPAHAVDVLDLRSDFGAVGDGIADDTDALQDALDTGQPVSVPVGVYRITDTVDLRSGSELSGVAGSEIVLETGARIQGDGISEVALTGLTLRRPVTTTAYGNEMVRVYRSDHLVLSGLTLLDHREYSPAIEIAGRWEDTSADTLCHDITIDDVTVTDYQRESTDGTYVQGTGISVAACANFSVTGSIVTDTQGLVPVGQNNFQGAGIQIISSIGGIIDGNTVTYAGQGIDIGGGHNIPDRTTADLAQTTLTGFRGTRESQFTNNVVSDIWGPGIKLVNGASDNDIRGNEVTRAGLTAIWISPGTNSPRDLTVTEGNLIEDNTVIDPGEGFGASVWTQTRAGSGIGLEPGFDDPAYASADNRVRDNIVRDNVVSGDPSAMPYGVTDRGFFAYSNYPGGAWDSVDNTIGAHTVTGAGVADIDCDPARNTCI
jgi:hypothetical protein